ncbi:hypothetical protein [Salinarimonas soli]|uniref:DUF4148 domain-containing protein n=1 Tax=Salinarimonas soli TaxID=1638099 RepID=A0A5B2VH08_9HYPH|nr:hypothetical protein [Salinarimonas soli]KAA2237790.1 hypothetical protein F0L46_08955 [Salinarimonas soli]
MTRMLILLPALAILAAPAAISDAAAEGISRSEARAISRGEVRRSNDSERALRRLGATPGAQSQPVITAPSQTGSSNGGGGYRAGSGTMVVPNR